jgi:hypothetical protein
MPCAPSIATCALEAAMSSRQKRLSKPIEALISRISAEGPPPKRPPHIRFEGLVSSAMAASPLRKWDYGVTGVGATSAVTPDLIRGPALHRQDAHRPGP